MEFKFENIKNDLFAAADIYWQKKLGSSILISKKGDILNLPLINKLLSSGHSLDMQNGIDLSFQNEMSKLYENYNSEILMNRKLMWREQLIQGLFEGFVEKRKTQFELCQLGWRFFSSFNIAEGVAFAERDGEVFKRHLNVATAYAFCAFLLGYYEPKFLSYIFTHTTKNLMNLGEGVMPLTLKEKLEEVRIKNSLKPDDHNFIKKIASEDVVFKTAMFEKYDGSGIRKLNSREMSDLDLIYIAIDGHFSFRQTSDLNILSLIANDKINGERKILKMIQRVLNRKLFTNKVLEA